jgi:hypothetical protein
MRMTKRIECGSYGGYQRHKRRKEVACGPCREAANAYRREWRWRTGQSRPQAEYLTSLREARKHGTGPMYLKARCRCVECKAWNRGYMAGYRHGRRERDAG